MWACPPGVGWNRLSSLALSPRSNSRSLIPRNCRSSSSYSLLLALVVSQRQGFLATLVHLDNGLGALSGDDLHVGGNVLIGRVGAESSQNVALKQVVVVVLSLQDSLLAGQLLACFYVAVYLVVQTALQLGAHSSKNHHALQQDVWKPLLNRAIMGQYPG